MGQKDWAEQDNSATVVVSRNNNGHYIISAGNLVETADGEALMQGLESLRQMDKAQLKAAYKEQLRRPRETAATSGAGLGLIDIARKASEPLQSTLGPSINGRAFFSLRAVI